MEVAIIALTPVNPITIILEVVSIGVALASSIKQQKQYLEQLRNAKSAMIKAIGDVDKANGRINQECGKLETSWGHLLENGRRTLDNVNVRDVLANLLNTPDQTFHYSTHAPKHTQKSHTHAQT